MELLYIMPQMSILFVLVMIGFLIGKLGNVSGLDISKTLIFFLFPLLIFYASYNVELSFEVMIIPFISICLMSTIQYISLFVLKYLDISEADKFVLTFINTSKNCGYLGIPVATLIFEPNILNMYILTILGYAIHQSTFGIYFISRSKYSIKKSLINLSTIPIIYTSILGFSLNYFDIGLPQILVDFKQCSYGAYSIFGMLIVGFGFSKFEKCEFSKNFIIIPSIFQFIIWPLLVLFLVYIDKTYFGYFNLDFYKIFLLFSLLPVGANVIAFSYVFTDKVSKTSLAVMLSTTISLIYIPVMIWYLGIFSV